MGSNFTENSEAILIKKKRIKQRKHSTRILQFKLLPFRTRHY
jgi:hypothetical protein